MNEDEPQELPERLWHDGWWFRRVEDGDYEMEPLPEGA